MEKWMERLHKEQGLAEEEIHTLVSMGEKRRFSAGDLVLRSGETDTHIYIIADGIWRSFCLRDGEEATMWFSVEGEITFSVWGYISNAPSRLSIESVTDSCAYAIPRFRLMEAFTSSLQMANLGRHIVEQFVVLYENWHVCSWHQNALERYLQLMDNHPEVIHQVPLKHIASYLGVTPQSLSRIRASLNNIK